MNTIPPLSVAIMLGAMLRPQKFGTWRKGDTTTCALYAGCEAAGILGHATMTYYDAWPWLHRYVCCPACKWFDSVAATIAHLNDKHFWTRERIADWVQEIEPQEAAVWVGRLEKQGVG